MGATSAASKTDPFPPSLAQHRLKAVVIAVPRTVKEAHVIIPH